jgi:hypothetical protein
MVEYSRNRCSSNGTPAHLEPLPAPIDLGEKSGAHSPRERDRRGLAEERKRTKVSLGLPNTPFPDLNCAPPNKVPKEARPGKYCGAKWPDPSASEGAGVRADRALSLFAQLGSACGGVSGGRGTARTQPDDQKLECVRRHIPLSVRVDRLKRLYAARASRNSLQNLRSPSARRQSADFGATPGPRSMR